MMRVRVSVKVNGFLIHGIISCADKYNSLSSYWLHEVNAPKGDLILVDREWPGTDHR